MLGVITFYDAAIHKNVHVFVVAVNVREENNPARLHFWLLHLLVEIFDQALSVVNGWVQKLTWSEPPSVQIHSHET